MNNQEDRSGSLLILSDIALILSTYGVLLLFNLMFEPLNANTWIVCTFFVGIKILIVGIADITGIGRSYVVSLLFVLLADGIIILINQLMAFGLSIRLMALMLVADIIFVLIAVFIWKRMGKHYTEYGEEVGDWVYDDQPAREINPRSPAAKKKPVPKQETPQVATQDEELVINQPVFETAAVDDTDDIFDFHSLNDDTFTDSNEDNISSIFSGLNDNDFEGGEDYLKFDELTMELPSEDEIDQAMSSATQDEQTEQDVVEESLDSSYDYFSGLGLFDNVGETASSETQTEENKLNTFNEEVFELEEEPIEVEAALEPEIEESVTEEVQTEVEPEISLFETEPEPEIEPVVEEEKVESTPVEVEEEQTEEIQEEETIPEIEETTSDRLINIFDVNAPEIQEEVEPEEEPLFVNTLNDFYNVIGVAGGLLPHFQQIPVSIDEVKIESLRDELKQETLKLNDYLNKLTVTYNESVSDNRANERITNFVQLDNSYTLNEADKILRENIEKIRDKEFVSDNVMQSIGKLTTKLADRNYSINFAADNLKERRIREQQIEAEKERRRRNEELEKQRREREEALRRAEEQRQRDLQLQRKAQLERERQQQEKLIIQQKEAERKAAQEQATNKNEIHLQNDGLDIIIDAADLELLSEFLAQQQAEN